jgi:hypothetical protein
MNRSAITLFHEIGQVARVVNVRVAQYHRINLPRVKWKRTIPLRSLFAMTLKQAAFQQQPPAIDFQQIHRARGGARRAEEVDFHRAKKTAADTKSRAELLCFDARLRQT